MGIAGSLSRTFHSGLPRRTANEISRFPMDIHLVPEQGPGLSPVT